MSVEMSVENWKIDPLKRQGCGSLITVTRMIGWIGSPWPSSPTTTELTHPLECHHSMSPQGSTLTGEQQSQAKGSMSHPQTLSGEWRKAGKRPGQNSTGTDN